MSDKIRLTGYERNYDILNEKTKQDSELLYELGLLIIITNELKKGFKVIKINKPTKQGTKFKFATIENEKDMTICIEDIKTRMKKLNTKWDNVRVILTEEIDGKIKMEGWAEFFKENGEKIF